MINHEVEVAQFSTHTPSGDERVGTLGSIIVKPPIAPGEFFKSAIYGREGHGVSLSHVVTTSEETVFVAGVAQWCFYDTRLQDDNTLFVSI